MRVRAAPRMPEGNGAQAHARAAAKVDVEAAVVWRWQEHAVTLSQMTCATSSIAVPSRWSDHVDGLIACVGDRIGSAAARPGAQRAGRPG